MEPSVIFDKIIELAREYTKQEELRKFCKINVEKVLVELPRRILRNDGGNIIDCIFIGLHDNKNIIKVKVIDKVLKTGREEPMSLTHCGDILSKVCLELPRMPVECLIRWSSECVQSIVNDGDVNMIWKDILPECLNTVSVHNLIKHCGSEMTGEEFKIQCVHTLCQCQWKEKQLVQLAAMFKDLQLPKLEHKQVVNKLCSYIVDLPPETLPPLVHQLLKLCKLYNTEVVLSHLSHYFNIRLYSKLEPPPQDSESTTIDMEDIVEYSHAELSRCLSTCLYHITQGVAEPEMIRKHLKQWPKTQLLRAPFIIDLALAVSDKGTDFKSVCMDIIKSAIELNILDKIRSSESSWVRSVLPPEVDVVNVLKVLTTESANHRQLTVLGLINLAFSLLAVSRIKPTASTCWSHGKLILVRLCKAQPETTGHILGQLADRLFSDQYLPQYTDCLYVLCKLTPVSVERSAQLLTILENCQPLPGQAQCARTYEAARPLVAYSARVRDVLVMVCRKGLYSRDSAYRCLALSGFLTVLRHIKLSKGNLVMSQNNFSDDCSEHSYLTQIAVDMHSNSQGSTVTSRMRNEIICLEVVSILRRCLVQDAVVKQLLYTEMYDCAKEKPALHESILELFYEHLIKYLQEEDDNWQLLLDKCAQETPFTANLIEPIGRLLYVVAQFLQPIPEDNTEDCLASQSDNSAAYLKAKLMDIMNQLCKIDLLSLISMENVALTDLSPESKAKSLTVQQLMQCLEALIAHQVLQWNPSSTLAESTHRLYKQHTQLLDNTKSSPKTKKTQSFNQTKDDKKSQKPAKKGKDTKANSKNKPINDSQETTISQKTQEEIKATGSKRSLTQKSGKSQKSPKKNKMSNLVKDRAGPFKPLPCLWDMQVCLRILDLLYGEEVPWSSTEQRNYIRSKCDFHLYSIRNIQSVMGEKLEKKVVTHVLIISELLYKRCVCRFQDMCDFDERTTLACLELFKTSLNVLLSPSYSLKIESVLSGITGIADKPVSASLANMLETIYTIVTHLESEAAEEDLDLIRKKILTIVVQIAATLLETSVLACSALHEVILKLEDYIRSSKQAESLQLLPALLTTEQRQQREAILLDQVLEKLTLELGVIDEDETSPTEETVNFPTIDSRSGHSVLSYVCLHLSNRFKCAEHLLNRARDLSNALLNAVHVHQQRIDKELRELYKSTITELCQLGAWTARAAALRCRVGAGSERVLAVCVRLYAALGVLVRQIEPATAVALRLDRLLKFTGKKLSAIIDSLITYMESSQDQQKASKVLRDTKLIPRLVLEAEQFSKHVLLLGSKAKINFKQYLSIGTARDFKIKAPVLEEFLNNREATNHESEDEEAEEARDNEEGNVINNECNINDAATAIISPVISDQEPDDSDDEPPIIIKRKRRS